MLHYLFTGELAISRFFCKACPELTKNLLLFAFPQYHLRQEYIMNRKYMTFGVLFFLLLPAIVSAQQATKADIQSLEKKVQALETRVSNLEITVKEMDKRLTNKIEELDKRLTNKIEEMDKRLTTQIQAVNVRISELREHISAIVNILIGVVLAAIALPQVLGYLQDRRKQKELQKQIQELGERIERQQQDIFEKLVQQQQEIEIIKSQRFITPS
jgi:septal ring factor EnvC (AmiA/AmiB activator)